MFSLPVVHGMNLKFTQGVCHLTCLNAKTGAVTKRYQALSCRAKHHTHELYIAFTVTFV